MFELARRSIEAKLDVSFKIFDEAPSKNIEEGVLIYKAFVLADPYWSFTVKKSVVPIDENVLGSWTSLLCVLTSTRASEFDPDVLTTVGVPVIVVW
jgi:hypothetical protein